MGCIGARDSEFYYVLAWSGEVPRNLEVDFAAPERAFQTLCHINMLSVGQKLTCAWHIPPRLVCEVQRGKFTPKEGLTVPKKLAAYACGKRRHVQKRQREAFVEGLPASAASVFVRLYQ